MSTLEEIDQKVRKLCELRGFKDDEEVISNCWQIIDRYLSFKGSSLGVVDYYLQNSLDNGAWIFAWKGIKEETEKLSGEFYVKQKKYEQEQMRILLDYNPLDLGERFLTEEELSSIKVDLGVIDANGVFHTGERNQTKVDHRKLANYLRLRNKIIEYYIRVGCVCGHNDGILCAESISYGDNESLKHFLLTEKMAIALYNGIMSKRDRRFSTFEEKLAYYGDEFGYYSLKYNSIYPIYNKELFDNNMKVLSYTLGKRFDKKFFIDVLKK